MKKCIEARSASYFFLSQYFNEPKNAWFISYHLLFIAFQKLSIHLRVDFLNAGLFQSCNAVCKWYIWHHDTVFWWKLKSSRSEWTLILCSPHDIINGYGYTNLKDEKLPSAFFIVFFIRKISLFMCWKKVGGTMGGRAAAKSGPLISG